MDDCLFCKIVEGKIPSKKIYEDEHTFAFEDIDPKAPTHVLVVPKKHIVGLKEARDNEAEIIGADRPPPSRRRAGRARRRPRRFPLGDELRRGRGSECLPRPFALDRRTRSTLASRVT